MLVGRLSPTSYTERLRQNNLAIRLRRTSPVRKGKLHEAIDRMTQRAQKELRCHEKRKDTAYFWKAWSKAVGSGRIEYLQLEKELAKKNRGRWEAKLIKKTPERTGAKQEKGHRQHEWTRKAVVNLKNARSCKQIAYRPEMLQHKTGEKVEALGKLNAEAYNGIHKAYDRKCDRRKAWRGPKRSGWKTQCG